MLCEPAPIRFRNLKPLEEQGNTSPELVFETLTLEWARVRDGDLQCAAALQRNRGRNGKTKDIGIPAANSIVVDPVEIHTQSESLVDRDGLAAADLGVPPTLKRTRTCSVQSVNLQVGTHLAGTAGEGSRDVHEVARQPIERLRVGDVIQPRTDVKCEHADLLGDTNVVVVLSSKRRALAQIVGQLADPDTAVGTALVRNPAARLQRRRVRRASADVQHERAEKFDVAAPREGGFLRRRRRGRNEQTNDQRDQALAVHGPLLGHYVVLLG